MDAILEIFRHLKILRVARLFPNLIILSNQLRGVRMSGRINVFFGRQIKKNLRLIKKTNNITNLIFLPSCFLIPRQVELQPQYDNFYSSAKQYWKFIYCPFNTQHIFNFFPPRLPFHFIERYLFRSRKLSPISRQIICHICSSRSSGEGKVLGNTSSRIN